MSHQINPKNILEQGVIVPSEFTKVQQVGIDLSLKEKVALAPKSCANVIFNETINLPVDMFALFFTRSSYSRRGIFTTSGVYDPGYVGSLGCTIYNLSNEDVSIVANERIGQLVCYKADAASAYDGQWQGK